ncbi:hypothetical protein AB6A40_000545 [Gnathostoma spinigerum]|uniref:Adenylate kinase n=1 Tax=Gnathostoma spinigerum TaxID=75299 RepID=A0ABD6E3J1_9BILA
MRPAEKNSDSVSSDVGKENKPPNSTANLSKTVDSTRNIESVETKESTDPTLEVSSTTADVPEKTPKVNSIVQKPLTASASESSVRSASKALASISDNKRNAEIETKTTTTQDTGSSANKISPGKQSSTVSTMTAADATATTAKETQIASVPAATDSPLSAASSASTPSPAGGAGAQLVSQMALERNMDDSIETLNDPFPKGLPNNAPVILIIGAPGSNKSTIAAMIAKKYDGFLYLSMGDLLRQQVHQNMNDELWLRIQKKMNNGEPVPMKLCRELLYAAFHKHGKNNKGYVVEGYPRNQAQIQDFENQMGRLDLALLVDCTENFCIQNISRRYAESSENPNGRLDNRPEIARVRLNAFKQNTLPMLKYLDDKSKLKVVDGDVDVKKVFNEVVSTIDNVLLIRDRENGKDLLSSKNDSISTSKTTE